MGIKSNSKYDVVVIGGGPVGIYTSIKLAKAGFHVLVVEEDAQIGKPRFCTGLISKEAFEKFSLPKEAIEGEFHSAWVFSPLGSKVYLESKADQVYVTDRTIFDHGLYRQAKEIGVEFMLNCRCTGLKINDNYVEERIVFNGSEATVKSEIAVLATGVKYNLHKHVGLSPPSDFLDCSQIQVCGESDGEIEIFVGNSVAPHSFAWVVPLKEKKLRIGLSTRQNSSSFLKSFLKYLKLKGRIDEDKFDIIKRPVPLGAIKKTYACRILVVGDAAGQVKPTTGGGIYFGLLCADLAAKTVNDAFKRGNFRERFLHHYEINWKKKIEFDLTMSLYLRKLVAYCNDEQIERLIRFCSQESIQKLIEKYADFNHHGRFIKELIKRPAFWKSLYQILTIK
ncbi:MAG: NAD(P)/FAD-dependent oxidoreductase [Candidatus Omnitrophica bacterium]|nr:NAD(P)/FAD-dependent oxidoreductase [Candidatus Omnitrophota bacterium]